MSRTRSIILLVLLLAGFSAQAQRFSYVYIQGDKQTPFYVKLNGDMQPRYGKNYCILPQLEAGTIKLDILFQQNLYPAQQFTIRVPENGNRAFMITRRDQQFSLYDLQQHFYLQAGNTETDDHLPELVASQGGQPVAKTASPEDTAEEPVAETPHSSPKEQIQPVSYRRTKRKKTVDEQPQHTPDEQQVTTTKAPAESQPAFLDNVKLNNDHELTEGTVTTTQKSVSEATDTAILTQKKPLDATFRNSDCPQPLPDADFERIYKSMMQQQTDEDRVGYLNGQLDKCYQAWQARTLGTMLNEDAARFTFLKNIYPHITDQQAFPLLDDMLRSDVWRAQFTQLTHR